MKAVSEALATSQNPRYGPSKTGFLGNLTCSSPLAMEEFLRRVSRGEANITAGRYYGFPTLNTWPHSRSTRPQPPTTAMSPNAKSNRFSSITARAPGKLRTRKASPIPTTKLSKAHSPLSGYGPGRKPFPLTYPATIKYRISLVLNHSTGKKSSGSEAIVVAHSLALERNDIKNMSMLKALQVVKRTRETSFAAKIHKTKRF